MDATLARVGDRVVLGLPLGIGKPNLVANEFYRRAARDPALHLTILTALSLTRPRARSDLERRLLEPIVERVFADYPELDYVRAARSGTLPPNIEVIEFFFEPGAWLEAYSVFLRRSPGAERALPLSFDARDAAGTALLSVVSVPALSAANAPRRRGGATGTDLLLVTPTDVPVARLARSGPAEQFVLLLPSGSIIGWAAVARDATPPPAPGLGAGAGSVDAAVDALLSGGVSVGLTLGTEPAAPPWARLRMLSASEGEITTTTGLLVATTAVDVAEPTGKRASPTREHRLSYRTDITPLERLLTVTALIVLDLATL